MSTQILMPALSPTMEEGTLAKWLVKEGQTVKAGDVIAEIETDKATMEVEAVDEGTVAQILVPAGTDNVKVGTVIAMIAGEGEDASKPAEAPAAAPQSAAPATTPDCRRSQPDMSASPRPLVFLLGVKSASHSYETQVGPLDLDRRRA